MISESSNFIQANFTSSLLYANGKPRDSKERKSIQGKNSV